ncbi:MAG: glutaredoxin domain-containing protein [Tahibacter sp.]
MTPLKLLLGVALIAIASIAWMKQREVARHDPRHGGGGSGGIVVLSASWCGYCAQLREGLEQAHVPFTELDVEDEGEGEKAYEAVGGSGVPITIIGEDVVHGYDAERISALIGRRGYTVQL